MLDIKMQALPISLVMQESQDNHLEICRLLAAATVNHRFENLLLENPELALQIGYQGETFLLTNEERALLLSIRANTLADLAYQLARTLDQPSHLCSSYSAIL